MKGLIQRVSEASVNVGDEKVGSIGKGILLLLGVERHDSPHTASKLLDKVLSYRIFPDSQGKMNLSLQDVGGGLLIVSQFTLVADTGKGLRPSFSSAADPQTSLSLYEHFVAQARDRHAEVATGRFGADMQVKLINDGPVTFLLEAVGALP